MFPYRYVAAEEVIHTIDIGDGFIAVVCRYLQLARRKDVELVRVFVEIGSEDVDPILTDGGRDAVNDQDAGGVGQRPVLISDLEIELFPVRSAFFRLQINGHS